MKSTVELYSWKTYSCRNCKESFNGNDLFRIPSGWNHDVRICKNCYQLSKEA